uniref:CAF17 C-terminal domain-containing protein n=1 Tax=Cajanus cajan TaxID=3821 RepID=A0A151TJJ4_CAJCA|nr:hypothetical protein KK1_013526 [Cajanus cajan]
MNRVALPKSIAHRFRWKQFSNRCESQVQNVGPVASLLKSRSVIRFCGPDTLKFLQGLLTNDVRRFLYDLVLYKPPTCDTKLDHTGSGPHSHTDQPFHLFADVDASILDELLQTFNNAGLLEKSSQVEELEAAFVGWGAGLDRTAMSSSHGSDHGWQWFKDPRLVSLGFQGIFPSNITPPLIEVDKETDEHNFLLWRIEKGVAEGSTEIPKGEAVPLEYNLAGLNAISFDKELVNKVVPGSEVMNVASGKKAGIVTTALGCRGLGLLRLEEALKGSSALCIQGQEDVKVVASRPDWWPSEWLQDHGQHATFA